MNTYHPSMSQDSFKVGEKYLFLVVKDVVRVQDKHKFFHEKVIGTVIDKGKTGDNIPYILTDVGYCTKKFVTDCGAGNFSSDYFVKFDSKWQEVSYAGIQEVSDGGVAEVKEGVAEVTQKRAKGGITEVSAGGITEVKDDE